jgi:benzylsuccinate CoA-transferase BbsF subunit
LKRPYEGLRVLEFTHVWAGPLCGQLLADAGADVVKLESRGHLDVHRRAGPYASGVADINASGVWNAQNRGKRSVALNLKKDAGIEIALDLLATADVVIDNFRPGVLKNLGLSSDLMQARNPALVGVSISGFGLEEKWRNYPAYGPTMDAVAGLSVATADAEGRPQAVNGWLPDVSASLFAAVAIISAIESASSGTSIGWIDIDELLSTLALLPEQAVAEQKATTSGADRDVIGSNRYPGGDVCCVLACRGDDEWVAFRLSEIEGADWPLITKAVANLLNAHISVAKTPNSLEESELAELVRGFDKSDVARVLQEIGIEAVPVNAAPDLLIDRELDGRDSYVTQHLPSGEVLRSYGSVIRWNDEPRLARVAPQFGEHTREVLEEWLGFSAQQIQALESQEQLFW